MAKITKTIKRTLLLTGGLVAASVVMDRYLGNKEKKDIEDYGRKIHTTYGTMNIEMMGDEGPVFVLLSGLGTPAPILNFRPLAKAIAQFARVVTIEYYGYGCSSAAMRPRTVKNITQEVHQLLQQLQISNYYLVAHSISAIYALPYMRQYANEILGFVSLDGSVPSQLEYMQGDNEGALVEVLKSIGLLRWINKAKQGIVLPPENAYTEEELKQIKARTFKQEYNFTLKDEVRKLEENILACRDIELPHNLPVLMFLSHQNIKLTRGWWEKIHVDQINHVEKHKCMILRGNHYLHWTHSTQIADEIKAFFAI